MAGKKTYRVELPGNRACVLAADRCYAIEGHLLLIALGESGAERITAQFAPHGWLHFIEEPEAVDG